MTMQIPKFNETFLPILKVLLDGRTVAARDLYQEVESSFYADVDPEFEGSNHQER